MLELGYIYHLIYCITGYFRFHLNICKFCNVHELAKELIEKEWNKAFICANSGREINLLYLQQTVDIYYTFISLLDVCHTYNIKSTSVFSQSSLASSHIETQYNNRHLPLKSHAHYCHINYGDKVWSLRLPSDST